MGESPCLTRSISYPTNAARESKEGDPYRALTESISFGRYMSESLAWEKWSTFSHNRYLEEAEKYSKPGSVAQMKAFFEAHFRKRAAKKAAALCGEVNAVINEEPTLPTLYETDNDSSVNAELARGDSCMGINEQQETNALDTIYESDSIIRDDMEVNELASNPVDGRDDLAIREAESVEAATEQSDSVDSPINSRQHENAHEKDQNASIQEENTPAKEASKMEQLSLSSKKRQVNSPTKSSTSKGTFKLPMFSAKLSTSESSSNGTNVAPHLKKSGGDSNVATKIKKSGGSDNKKRLLLKSLHMSINFGSHACESRASLKLAKDSSTSSRTQMRVSACGMPRHPPKVLQSEDKRTKTPLNESVSGGVKADGKQETLTVDLCRSLKSSSTRGIKAPSPIKFSPFSFKTDERAAKRKEFYQKLQEKTKAKETEKVQLQARLQEKAEHEVRKQLESSTFKAEDTNCRPQSTSNFMKKIALTKPQSPKLGRKPTLRMVQDTISRPPHGPSVDTERPKRAMQKNIQRTAFSVTSLPKKTARENSSPNIQR